MGRFVNPFTDEGFKIVFGQEMFTKEQEECETYFEKWIYIFKNMNILERMPWAARRLRRRHHTLIPCGGLQMLSACFFVLLIN